MSGSWSSWAAEHGVIIDHSLKREHMAVGVDFAGPPDRFSQTDEQYRRRMTPAPWAQIYAGTAPAFANIVHDQTELLYPLTDAQIDNFVEAFTKAMAQPAAWRTPILLTKP